MKYLVVILVVVLLLWLARNDRRVPPPSTGEGAGRRNVPPARAMVACAYCGLHLPRDEALPGRGGLFCGEAHRTAYETGHPAP
jgi:uncharacterized protein